MFKVFYWVLYKWLKPFHQFFIYCGVFFTICLGSFSRWEVNPYYCLNFFSDSYRFSSMTTCTVFVSSSVHYTNPFLSVCIKSKAKHWLNLFCVFFHSDGGDKHPVTITFYMQLHMSNFLLIPAASLLAENAENARLWPHASRVLTAPPTSEGHWWGVMGEVEQ